MTVGFELDPVLGSRQILSHQPKVDRMPRKRVEGHVRKPAQELRQSLGLDHGAMRFAKALDAADFQLPTFSGGVRTDCVVGIERDSLSGTKSLASEVPHGRDSGPLVGARARRMRVRGPAFGPALAQTHRAYGGRDRG